MSSMMFIDTKHKLNTGQDIFRAKTVKSLVAEIERLQERMERLDVALKFLLGSRNCWSPQTGVEIPEMLSAEFDIGLDGARDIITALDGEK